MLSLRVFYELCVIAVTDIVFGSENTYFGKHETKGKRYYYRENEVIRMYIAVFYR
jgi:hypothetical protein